jgi:hypothetical protein
MAEIKLHGNEAENAISPLWTAKKSEVVEKGRAHVAELAGLGCVDILGTSVRRRNDSERE